MMLIRTTCIAYIYIYIYNYIYNHISLIVSYCFVPKYMYMYIKFKARHLLCLSKAIGTFYDD